jgi:cysteine desulfurase
LSDQSLAAVDAIPGTSGGAVDPDALDDLLGDDVLLVSVMAANSETGVLNPVAEIAERVHAAGALFHCDATQYAGRLPFDLSDIGVDLVSLSSHKICGPGGVGALVTAKSSGRLRPIIHGGGHERSLRSGSLNVAGIVGFGAAAEIAVEERMQETDRIRPLRDRLVAELKGRLTGVEENGDIDCRLPNTANIRFAGADAEAVVANMDPVAVSTGSACSAGAIEPSAVLLAMGLSREAAFESVRFSLGRFTTDEEIVLAAQKTIAAVGYVRAMNGGEA